ncbi:DUF6283 family protein [Nocardia sp. NPDC059691]|uniref:DUF6283 family protein n=1 Tax=Nocardia sp. NPDC059691 TaxID=3346908 RepID=UPI0036928DB2
MNDHDHDTPTPGTTGHRRQLGPPAADPCRSRPYRRDVPSGIWDASEYDELPRYGEPTYNQPPALWVCHQTDRDHPASRVCAGWVGLPRRPTSRPSLRASDRRGQPRHPPGRLSAASRDSPRMASSASPQAASWHILAYDQPTVPSALMPNATRSEVRGWPPTHTQNPPAS